MPESDVAVHPEEPYRHQSETEAGRARDRQEFRRLTRRYTQLAWCTSVNEQRERAALNTAIMKLYSTLFPSAAHFWYDDYDDVVRATRARASTR